MRDPTIAAGPSMKAPKKGKARMQSASLQILDEADVPVQDLVDDADNANVHSEVNLAAIMASLQRFGMVERLIVRKSDNVVFAGNGRVECCRRLAWKTARVQFIEGTDLECRAYAIASNQTTRLSRWNDDLLLPQLQEIVADDLGGLLAATGFNLDDLADMKALAEETHAHKESLLPRGEGGTVATCPECGATFQLGGKKE